MTTAVVNSTQAGSYALMSAPSKAEVGAGRGRCGAYYWLSFHHVHSTVTTDHC